MIRKILQNLLFLSFSFYLIFDFIYDKKNNKTNKLCLSVQSL
jgi:hypothetical protein